MKQRKTAKSSKSKSEVKIKDIELYQTVDILLFEKKLV